MSVQDEASAVVDSAATPEMTVAPAPAAAPNEDLATRLADAEVRANDYKNEALRARAEMENLRKRTARDVDNAHKYGLERLINEFLPVKESLDLGLTAAESATEIGVVREGLDLTLKMFNSALERLGVTEIVPAGQKFNPDLHQAIGTEPSTTVEPGTVATVVQKGYLLRDRVLRPALVRVAVAPPSDG